MTIEQYHNLAKKKSGNGKYRNVRVNINGKWFDSKAEGNYYLYLLGQRLANEIKYFLRQVPLDLSENIKNVYRADFMVFNLDGTHDFIDIKGVETKEFKLKSTLVQARYNKPIILVKKVENALGKLALDIESNSYVCVSRADFVKHRIRDFDIFAV